MLVGAKKTRLDQAVNAKMRPLQKRAGPCLSIYMTLHPTTTTAAGVRVSAQRKKLKLQADRQAGRLAGWLWRLRSQLSIKRRNVRRGRLLT